MTDSDKPISMQVSAKKFTLYKDNPPTENKPALSSLTNVIAKGCFLLEEKHHEI